MQAARTDDVELFRKKEPRAPLSARVRESLLAEIDELAKESGVSRGEAVEQLLERVMETVRAEKKKPRK